jgi:hypothetical protein
VVVLGLLFARSVPPNLPSAPRHPGVVSQGDHGHKQYFDHEVSQWANPPDTVLAIPPVLALFHCVAPSEPFVELVTDGLHYNRPPPLA